jgi:hypothetical protein
MAEVSNVITPQRYSQGFSYESYLAQAKTNRDKYQEHEAAFKFSSADAKSFKDIVKGLGGLKALAIVEDWCPDAHRGLPVLSKIARASGMELRVFYRDANPDIMNLYLKEGKYQSIPVFAFFDDDFRPLAYWIERPAVATKFMEEVSAELATKKLNEEQIRTERRARSGPKAETFRQETVKELKELLGKLPK